eukprot:scaffold95634_cov33-Tisochrysis_lutea.AAC.2
MRWRATSSRRHSSEHHPQPPHVAQFVSIRSARQRAQQSCRRRASSHQTEGASEITTWPAGIGLAASSRRPCASVCAACTLGKPASAAGARVAAALLIAPLRMRGREREGPLEQVLPASTRRA